MDLIFQLDEHCRRNLLHTTLGTEQYLSRFLLVENMTLLRNRYRAAGLILRQLFLKGVRVKYEDIDTPYRDWKRVRQKRKLVNKFASTTEECRFPQCILSPKEFAVHGNSVYIVRGFQDGGSYASVKPFVLYNGQYCVLKYMCGGIQDMFEIVTHLYLSQTSEKYINMSVPRIQFVQSSKRNCGTRPAIDVCMQRCAGVLVSELADDDQHLLIALAHTIKMLHFLQRDLNFMHRDLHSGNVFFDMETRHVSLIDFGMACVNPRRAGLAWQNRGNFYRVDPGTRAASCSNRSLDICNLILCFSKSNLWCHEEEEKMKIALKVEIDESNNLPAKVWLSKENDPDTFTDITEPNWHIGNNMAKNDAHNWWTYNMVEFPVAGWYPENVMRRMLYELPFAEWLYLSVQWVDFNTVVPKDIGVTVDDGRIGTVNGCSSTHLSILVGKRVIQKLPSQCTRENPILEL